MFEAQLSARVKHVLNMPGPLLSFTTHLVAVELESSRVKPNHSKLNCQRYDKNKFLSCDLMTDHFVLVQVNLYFSVSRPAVRHASFRWNA